MAHVGGLHQLQWKHGMVMPKWWVAEVHREKSCTAFGVADNDVAV
jgi:hypothetical protein